jgi:hypothetical protein
LAKYRICPNAAQTKIEARPSLAISIPISASWPSELSRVTVRPGGACSIPRRKSLNCGWTCEEYWLYYTYST